MNGLFADISNNNQQEMNFEAYKKHGKHILLGHKTTEGLTFVDQFHAERADRAHHKAHLWMMHYHFAHCKESPTEQAAFFWAHTAGHFAKLDFCAIDTERGMANDGIPAATVAHWTNEFAAHLKKISGHSIIMYSNESLLAELMRAGLRIPGDRAWIAAFGSSRPSVGGIRTWAWQYTDGIIGPKPHNFTGLGNCDGSRLNNGTFLRLAAARKP